MSLAPDTLETDEARRARHLSALRSLTDLGLALAQKAAARAHAQLDAPEPDLAPGQPAPPDHSRTFERYARIVRTLIMVEHRIATHAPQPHRLFRPATSPVTPRRAILGDPTRFGPDSDPRRPKLRQFIHQMTRSNPDAAEIRRAAKITMDEALDSDPGHTLPAGQILSEICRAYSLPFDITKLPDDFLVPPKPTSPELPARPPANPPAKPPD